MAVFNGTDPAVVHLSDALNSDVFVFSANVKADTAAPLAE